MKTPPPRTSKSLAAIALLWLTGAISAFAQVDSFPLDNNGYLAWQTAPASKVSTPGTTIATHSFAPNGDWFNETVPGTPFAAAVKQGRDGFTDASFGDNIYRVNASEKQTKKYNQNYWHRCDFIVPSWGSGKTYWLNFDGVNQQGDIYFNGRSLGSLFGFLKRGKYDVTSLVTPGQWATVAVLTYMPNDPIFDAWSPSYMGAPNGWDWMPPVPGADTGIVDHVYLTSSTGLVLVDPWMRTASIANNQATLKFSTDVRNTTGAAINATVTCALTQNGGQVGGSFSRTVSVPANSTANVVFDASSVGQLTINNPKLWWPNGYGEPNLYNCAVQVSNAAGTVSDKQNFNFGIRQYTYDKNGNDDSKPLVIKINGQKIFVRGGNWGQADYLLNTHNYTAYDYDIRVRLHKDMNMNMIRNWTGSTTEHEFYDACDKYGIMVWDDFWLANSMYGKPKNYQGFKDNAVEKIQRLRNRACIAVWCGANESVPGVGIFDNPPDYDLTSSLAWYVYAGDGNDRLYQASSNAGNLSGSGTWSWHDPHYYFSGGATYGNQKYGFRTELGTAALPTYESVVKFIPADHLWPSNADRGRNLTSDSMWQYHFWGNWEDANNRNNTQADLNSYASQINQRYGDVTGIQDLCKKAQLANIEATKAMFEGWNDQLFGAATGILTWMSQSAYPSVIWQTYDYYFDQTGAYWGAKKACEPVHIQWNPNNNAISVVNTTLNNLSNVTATATIYNNDGSIVTGRGGPTTLTVNSNTIQQAFTLNLNSSGLSAVHFIRLKLTNSSGTVLSENVYWHGNSDGVFTGLTGLGRPSLNPTTTYPAGQTSGQMTVTTVVNNPASSSVACAVRVQLTRKSDGARILPTIMSDNYFTLFKNESKTVTMTFDAALLNGSTPVVTAQAYNN